MGLGLNIPFGVDGKRYRQGLETMRKQTKSWGKSVGGIVAGAFAAGTVISIFKEWVQGLAEIKKSAGILNTTTQEMERLKNVAMQSKVEFDDLSEFVSNLNERVFEASIQAGHMEAEWSELGTTAAKMGALAPTEKMQELADLFEASTSKTNFASAAIALFGDDFKRVLPILAKGSEGIKQLGDEISVTSDSTKAAIEKMENTWLSLKSKAAGVFNFLVGAFMFVGTVIGTGWGAVFRAVMESFDTLGDAAGGLADVIIGALTLDPAQIERGLKTIGKSYTDTFDNLARNAKDSMRDIEKAWDDITAAESGGEAGTNSGDTARQAAAAKYAQELSDLKEKLHNEEKKRALELMSLEDKKKKLEAERAALAAKANDTSKEGVQAKRDLLKIDKQIADNNKKLQDKAAKKTKEDKAAAEEVRAKFDEVADHKKERAFNALSPADQKKQLQADLEANRLAQKGAGAGSKELAELQLKEQEILSANDGIQLDKEKDKNNSAPSVTSSSLASIGGGGGVFVATADPTLAEARKQGVTLNEIKGELVKLNNKPANGIKPANF